MSRAFELLLFSPDPATAAAAAAAGVESLVVDRESAGKRERQAGADTQISEASFADLARVRAATPAPARVICRIDRIAGGEARREIEAAIAAGADEVLLPMVRSASDIERALAWAGPGCPLGIMLETVAGFAAARDLAQLPLSRVYVGLNDLAIERRSRSLFAPLLDGTVERARELFSAPFGFGGLTLPDRGHPLPCRLLIAEMARLRCDFGVLRRSFLADVAGRDFAMEVTRLRAAMGAAFHRSAAEIRRDNAALRLALGAVPEGAVR